MNQIRILVADDHEVVRRGLVLVLRQEEDFEIVGETQDGAETVELCRTLTPDLVLLDWKMPKMNGLKAAKVIKDEQPTIRTLVLSGAPVETAVLDALDQGVDGFIHKDVSSDGLAHAIRVVAKGGSYLGPQVTQALLEKSRKIDQSVDLVPLSPRELEIVQLMATSATYKEIGSQLNISETTVHTHVKRIFTKLDQPNRTQAVIMALRLGLIEL
ncbi:MAG: response regulator transcription factor [Chloroflexota bacterium]